MVFKTLNDSGYKSSEIEPIRIGWISDLSGPVAKYGAYEAGMLAVEEVNKNGGINGRPLRLIVEDGKCNSIAAVNAANKLINIDKVKIIIGGHCTPESVAIAPIVEKNKVLMLASITSTPVLTDMGDYVFRTSPVSTIQAELVAGVAYKDLRLRNMAIVYEITDYAKPIAEKFYDEFVKLGGEVSVYESYTPGSVDFRTVLSKIRQESADAIYLSAQNPDSALNFMKQVKEMGLESLQLLGNDVAGIQANIDLVPDVYEGFLFALPEFSESNPKTKEFIEKYKKRYGVSNLPFGFWTAESYDGVMIIAEALKKYGEDISAIKNYLYNLRDYEGVSGKISIDDNGDGVRDYKVRIVRSGKVFEYRAE